MTSAGQHAAEVSAEAQRRPEEDGGPGAAGDPRPSPFTLLSLHIVVTRQARLPARDIELIGNKDNEGSVVSLTCLFPQPLFSLAQRKQKYKKTSCCSSKCFAGDNILLRLLIFTPR